MESLYGCELFTIFTGFHNNIKIILRLAGLNRENVQTNKNKRLSPKGHIIDTE